MRQGDGSTVLCGTDITVPLSLCAFADILLLVKLYHYVRYTVKQELKKEGKAGKVYKRKERCGESKIRGNMALRYGAVYETRGRLYLSRMGQ